MKAITKNAKPKIEIIKGIPIPTRYRRIEYSFPFADMEVNDVIKDKDRFKKVLKSVWL